jgi:hypothetical protein
MLDPDPYSINPDPQPWYKVYKDTVFHRQAPGKSVNGELESVEKRPRRSAGRSLMERNPDFVDVSRLPAIENPPTITKGTLSLSFLTTTC